jgi:hypothetical protein
MHLVLGHETYKITFGTVTTALGVLGLGLAMLFAIWCFW